MVDFEPENKNKKLKPKLFVYKDIFVVAVTDETGALFYLLEIDNEGYIIRNKHLPNDIGLKVDEAGRLLVKE
jgi:hypothetical protein